MEVSNNAKPTENCDSSFYFVVTSRLVLQYNQDSHNKNVSFLTLLIRMFSTY